MMLLRAAMQILIVRRSLFWVRHLEVLDWGVLLYFSCFQASLSSFFNPATNLIDGGKAKITIKTKNTL